jgi:predicted MPP superfamily phosphohydrolase
MLIFLLVFLSIYSALNYYVFIRGWQFLAAYPFLKPYYLLVFIVVAYSYIIAKVLYNYLHPVIHDALIWIGSFWFAYLVYFILFLLVVDLGRFVGFKLNLLPASFTENYELVKHITAVLIVIVVSLIILLGFFNSRNINIRTLNIEILKSTTKLNELNIVMAGDIHLSPINDEKFLSNIVEKINSLNPDIVLFPGDIVDDKAEVLRRLNIGKSFKKIKSKYGVFASNGNHEFINGVEDADRFMRENGIEVLRDTIVMIDDAFIISGREDRSINNFTNKNRKSLDSIINGVDRSYPIILLDHTPVNLDHARKNGIDLQLSGHTHHGQMWPANIITNLIYEISWGYKKIENTQYYVTSGAGTWGPPVRTGSRSEIVNIKINFTE